MQKKSDKFDAGARAVLKVHVANTQEANNELTEALATLNEALADLPGSDAHKAWPANARARILHKLGRDDEAVQTLANALVSLFRGYDAVIAKGDQAETKLNVWLAGIHLTFARICEDTNKPILAKHFAQSVLDITDPKNLLNERKKEARKILESLHKP